MSSQRKRHQRLKKSEHKRVLVVTEGKVTEPEYLELLNQRLRDGGVTVSVKSVGVGKDPKLVVEKCLELRDKAKEANKGFDHSVCLVDVDNHSTLAAASNLCTREGVILVVTNLKFEVWLLWHALDTRSSKSSKELDQLMTKHVLLKEKHIAPRFPIDGFKQAMEIASTISPEMKSGTIGSDPSSGMPLLVDILLGNTKIE